MTGWGRSRSITLWTSLACALMLLSACSSSPAKIPSASARPSAKPTTIAPGVRVSPSELALPPYSVSSTNPLPAGVSVRQVVKDVVIDNSIENAALESNRASLLQYSDSGALLGLDTTQVQDDQSQHLTILQVRDSVSSMQAGSASDPNNPASNIALKVIGSEYTRERIDSGKVRTMDRPFDITMWLVWSAPIDRYLACDVSSSS